MQIIRFDSIIYLYRSIGPSIRLAIFSKSLYASFKLKVGTLRERLSSRHEVNFIYLHKFQRSIWICLTDNKI